MTTEWKVGQRVTSVGGHYGTVDLVRPAPELKDDDCVIYVTWDGLAYAIGLNVGDIAYHKIVKVIQ